MKSPKEILNSKYADLCQKKGDLITQREKINEMLSQIDKEIDALNQATAHLPELQASILSGYKKFQNGMKEVKSEERE